MAVSLKDKIVLVVGASSGIGAATTKLFAEEGARIIASARREERLRALQQDLQTSGHQIEIYKADATNPNQMRDLVSFAEKHFGRVDILVVATGTNIKDRAMNRLRPELWDAMLNVNLSSAYYITQALLPHMREIQQGLLIYVSSISGILPDASGAAYQAAKRGLLGFAHALRFEEKENGIRTSVICPGLVETELLAQRPVPPSPDILKHALQPEDVAETILAIAKLPQRAAVPEVQILPSYL